MVQNWAHCRDDCNWLSCCSAVNLEGDAQPERVGTPCIRCAPSIWEAEAHVPDVGLPWQEWDISQSKSCFDRLDEVEGGEANIVGALHPVQEFSRASEQSPLDNSVSSQSSGQVHFKCGPDADAEISNQDHAAFGQGSATTNARSVSECLGIVQAGDTPDPKQIQDRMQSQHSTSLLAAFPAQSTVLEPRRKAVWVCTAMATICLQAAPILMVTVVCSSFTTQPLPMWLVMVHYIPQGVFLPWFAAFFMAALIDHRGSFSAASPLHRWASRYAIAAYFSSLVHMYFFALQFFNESNLSNSNENHLDTVICGISFLFHILFMLFALFMNVVAWAILGHMALLKLKMLVLAEPLLVYMGTRLFWSQVFFFTLWALLFLARDFLRQPNGDPQIPFIDHAFGAVGTLTSLSFFGFFGVVSTALRRTARMARAAVMESDTDAVEDQAVYRSARHTDQAAAFTAASATTTFLAVVAFGVQTSLELQQAWVLQGAASILDVVVNSACIALLSGRFRPVVESGGIASTESSKLMTVALSSAELQERRIREQFLEAMDPQSRLNTTTAATLAALVGTKDPSDLVSEAIRRFRGISWEVLQANPQLILDSSAIDGRVAPAELFQMSHACRLFECDAFFSHSWHDDAEQKWTALLKWCNAFRSNNGHSPKLWFDKVCINQAKSSST